MKVTSAGGTRFWVSSADDHEPYLVDITANNGLPVCTCRDFQCRCQPLLDQEKKIRQYGHTNRTICKHIQQVLIFMGASVIARACGKRVEEVYDQYEPQKEAT